MRYYKQTDSNYIILVGTGYGGTEISEAEYNDIMSAIQNKPQAEETTDYRLKDDLTWESYEVEPISESDDLDDSEVLEILLGGAS